MQSDDEHRYYLQKLNQLDLWKEKNKVNEIILETYKEWRQLWNQENNMSTRFNEA
jgi:hypothetical protein